MTAIDSLLRLQRWQIREQRQGLVDLEVLSERCQRDLLALRETLARASDSEQPGLQARCERLETTLTGLEQEAATLRSTLQEAIRAVEEVEQAGQNQKGHPPARNARRDAVIREDLSTQMYRPRGLRKAKS